MLEEHFNKILEAIKSQNDKEADRLLMEHVDDMTEEEDKKITDLIQKSDKQLKFNF